MRQKFKYQLTQGEFDAGNSTMFYFFSIVPVCIFYICLQGNSQQIESPALVSCKTSAANEMTRHPQIANRRQFLSGPSLVWELTQVDQGL